MEEKSMGKYAVGFGLSAAIMSVVSSLLVVAKEEYAPLLNWMKAALGHHWTTQGAIVMGSFLLLGIILSNTAIGKKWNAERLGNVILVSVVLGGLILMGFFLIEL
jgi:hypothetical protein